MTVRNPKTKRGKRWITRSVSMEPNTFRAGQKRAKEERRNFSSYIAWLIHRDAKQEVPA